MLSNFSFKCERMVSRVYAGALDIRDLYRYRSYSYHNYFPIHPSTDELAIFLPLPCTSSLPFFDDQHNKKSDSSHHIAYHYQCAKQLVAIAEFYYNR